MNIISLMWGGISKRRLYDIIFRQREIMEEQEAKIRVLRMAMDKVDLMHARATRDLVAHFLAAVEEEDEVLRDGIEAGLSDLNDHVARLEEHAES
jgi:predicted DNA-binding protein YlxM (UPF0122 family)